MSGAGVEEEYLWSCSLTAASKEYTWNPEDPADSKDDNEADPSVKPGHRLLIKTAILMPSAKKGEVTIVQIEAEGYNKEKVVVPMVAMRGGTDLQTYVDLLVPCQAKISILQGEGPIHLVGSHCVDFYGYRDTGAGEETDDEGLESEKEVTEKGDDKATPVKEDSKKRKASKDQNGSQEKVSKTASPMATKPTK